jgi:hypothetical protein
VPYRDDGGKDPPRLRPAGSAPFGVYSRRKDTIRQFRSLHGTGQLKSANEGRKDAERNALSKITSLIESGAIRPVVDKVFPFEATNEALAYVETGRAKGARSSSRSDGNFPICKRETTSLDATQSSSIPLSRRRRCAI